MLYRPFIANESSNSYLKRIGSVGWMAVEDPLCRIVGIWSRQAVWTFFIRYLYPALQVEGDLDKRSVCHLQRLIDTSYSFMILW